MKTQSKLSDTVESWAIELQEVIDQENEYFNNFGRWGHYNEEWDEEIIKN